MIDKLYRIFAGIWIGTIVFFSGVVAPQVFRYLPHDQAATLQNQLFPSYYIVGALCGFILFTLDLFRARQKLASLSLALALAVLGFVILTPMVRTAYLAHDPSLAWLHPTAIALNVITLVAVLIAI